MSSYLTGSAVVFLFLVCSCGQAAKGEKTQPSEVLLQEAADTNKETKSPVCGYLSDFQKFGYWHWQERCPGKITTDNTKPVFELRPGSSVAVESATIAFSENKNLVVTSANSSKKHDGVLRVFLNQKHRLLFLIRHTPGAENSADWTRVVISLVDQLQSIETKVGPFAPMVEPWSPEGTHTVLVRFRNDRSHVHIVESKDLMKYLNGEKSLGWTLNEISKSIAGIYDMFCWTSDNTLEFVREDELFRWSAVDGVDGTKKGETPLRRVKGEGMFFSYKGISFYEECSFSKTTSGPWAYHTGNLGAFRSNIHVALDECVREKITTENGHTRGCYRVEHKQVTHTEHNLHIEPVQENTSHRGLAEQCIKDYFENKQHSFVTPMVGEYEFYFGIDTNSKDKETYPCCELPEIGKLLCDEERKNSQGKWNYEWFKQEQLRRWRVEQ